MDVRGVEVTNQLRSAIRSKLLELGIRYDEELPDYILVMVVNKKSRQQMHEDLYLFLESCTTPFVDWLHDQVLKKLQKVTVARKKSSREFVPTVVVKQEEERKKRKTSTTSFLEDQAANQTTEKSTNKTLKEDKSIHKQPAKTSVVSSQKSETSQTKSLDKSVKNMENKLDYSTNQVVTQQRIQASENMDSNTNKETFIFETSNKSEDSKVEQIDDTSSRSLKRSLETVSSLEKKQNEVKKSKIEDAESTMEDNTRRLKSCVNKPKITSVVSIKNRLGLVSPRKKFEIHREKSEIESRYRLNEKRHEKHWLENNRNNNFLKVRNFDVEDRARRNREIDSKHNESTRINSIKTRLGNSQIKKVTKSAEFKEKPNFSPRPKSAEKTTGTIKDRLGTVNTNKSKQLGNKESLEFKNKFLEQDRDILANNKNIKNRLGPLKNNFKPVNVKSSFNSSVGRSQSSEDDDYLNLGAEEELDDNTQSAVNSGPIKSHIIAVNKSTPSKTERKRVRSSERGNKESSDAEEEIEETKIPSKVIVTPRPLKPLQPAQKRATQSLLLRAVAEANQSVVTQKNPEPSLLEKKQPMKHVKPTPVWDVGQNLSVHLNSNKRLVMEKIQVEVNTDVSESKSKPYVPQQVTEEHMDVVMSLFQRSDNNQKFLVTLNGYNNNLMKEKLPSEDDEQLEMEVNEDDELAISTIQHDLYVQNQSETSVFQISETEAEGNPSAKERTEENNENCNTENVEKVEEVPKKRRKLSPIIYNRSHSPSPADLKLNTVTNPVIAKRIEKKPLTENTITVIDKSKEKCKFWPNCTLGNKCTYLHPVVACSAFPACKFGDKCAYKHPKCKFGLSCTKLGCVFSHPAQQCKYHPFCNKPGCPYSHPLPATVETSTQRAKFTWRRRD